MDCGASWVLSPQGTSRPLEEGSDYEGDAVFANQVPRKVLRERRSTGCMAAGTALPACYSGRERMARHAYRADSHTRHAEILPARPAFRAAVSSASSNRCWASQANAGQAHTTHGQHKLWGTHLRAAVSSASSSRCCAWYESSDSPVAGMPLMHSVRPT